MPSIVIMEVVGSLVAMRDRQVQAKRKVSELREQLARAKTEALQTGEALDEAMERFRGQLGDEARWQREQEEKPDG